MVILNLLRRIFGNRDEAKSDSGFSYLEQSVPKPLIDNFISQAQQKIQTEGWGKQGRNVEVKTRNFVQCWITEEAFKQLLMKKNKWFRYRGLYFGDAAGAGADFTVRINGKETTIGLRSISPDSLNKWKSVAYPEDRFMHEKEKIADYHVVCFQEKGKVRLYGAISKQNLLAELGTARSLYSKNNQEHFRTVSLEKFALKNLLELMDKME
ncbi:hypothetical protein HZC30_01915 [Candidatus Woesearchaeota archaeon]|nr:hypothetical protein [Candidatus Woesearchaeota archaeon]